MAMTYFERKALLPHGAVSRVAEDVRCSLAKASAVLVGRMRDRDVETRLAALMRTSDGERVSVGEAFGPPARKLHKKAALMEVA